MEFVNDDLADSTKRIYRRNLFLLNGNKEPKNLKFLKKSDEILAKLENYIPNSRRTFLITIASVLKQSGDKKLYDIYYPHLVVLNNELKSNTTKSEKQTENWMTMDEVQELRKNMLKFLPKPIKNHKDYEKLLDLLLLSLYTLIPPRRNLDYLDMMCKAPEKDSGKNYYHNGKFYFQKFKTYKTYGEQTQDIPEDLQQVIDLYMKHKPESPHFLVRPTGSEFKSSNDITRRLNKIFGRNIGSGMMRNIFLTSKYSDKIDELKKDTKAMGTSVNTAENNYIKNI
jgi:hypothetical protein